MSDRDWEGFQRRRVSAPPPPLPPADDPELESPPAPAGQDPPAATAAEPPRPTRRRDRRRATAPTAEAPRRAQPANRATAANNHEPDQSRREPAAVWLPSALRERVRTEAEQRRMTQTALFVTAFNATHDSLRAAKPAAADGTAPLQRPPARRRYRVDGGTQLGLYLTEGELTIVDGFAAELGMSRSELATEVFEAYLQTSPRAKTRR